MTALFLVFVVIVLHFAFCVYLDVRQRREYRARTMHRMETEGPKTDQIAELNSKIERADRGDETARIR